jgi:hypothetical protein
MLLGEPDPRPARLDADGRRHDAGARVARPEQRNVIDTVSSGTIVLAASKAGGTRSRAPGRSVAVVVTNSTATGAVNQRLAIGVVSGCS